MIRDFINLLFPQWCAGCMGTLVSGEQNVCTMCRSDLRISSTYKERPNGIVSKFYGKIPVEHAFTMFQFTKRGVIQNFQINGPGVAGISERKPLVTGPKQP